MCYKFKRKIFLFFKELHNYIKVDRVKKIKIIDRNVSENYGAEILSNLNSFKRTCLQNFALIISYQRDRNTLLKWTINTGTVGILCSDSHVKTQVLFDMSALFWHEWLSFDKSRIQRATAWQVFVLAFHLWNGANKIVSLCTAAGKFVTANTVFY